MLQVVSVRRKSADKADQISSMAGTALLRHDERHVRRKAITLTDGQKVFVDLAEPLLLDSEDELVLNDGSFIEIRAADEELYSITTSNALRLMELIWHVGNRHLPAQIEIDRILIERDHVIKTMLEGLGATVTEVVEPFSPVRGAYSVHSHSHSHSAHSHHD